MLGVDPASADRAWRNRIGIVLQESELNPVYTVRETLTMFARYFDSPTPIDRTLDVVGLSVNADENYLSKNVASLWWPLSDIEIAAVKKTLSGWQHLNPYASYVPQTWYFKKSG